MITFRRLGAGEHVLETTTWLPLAPDEVFPFFADAENLERITPPELSFSIVTPTPIAMREGALIDYRLRLFGLPFRWRTRITDWSPPVRFTDEQLSGPYHTWVHTHTFEGIDGGTVMTDRVRFRLPLGVLGAPVLPLVRLQLRRIFGFRREALRRILIAEEAAGPDRDAIATSNETSRYDGGTG